MQLIVALIIIGGQYSNPIELLVSKQILPLCDLTIRRTQEWGVIANDCRALNVW